MRTMRAIQRKFATRQLARANVAALAKGSSDNSRIANSRFVNLIRSHLRRTRPSIRAQLINRLKLGAFNYRCPVYGRSEQSNRAVGQHPRNAESRRVALFAGEFPRCVRQVARLSFRINRTARVSFQRKISIFIRARKCCL